MAGTVPVALEVSFCSGGGRGKKGSVRLGVRRIALDSESAENRAESARASMRWIFKRQFEMLPSGDSHRDQA